MARRRRTLSRSLKAGAVILSLALVGVAATSAAGLLQGRQLFAMRGSDVQTPRAADPEAVAAAGTLVDDHVAAPSDSAPAVAQALAASPSPLPSPAEPPPASAPIVSEGRTDLGDGLFAVRDGRTVTVHFDVPQA